MLIVYAILAVIGAVLCWGTERVDRPRRRALREQARRAETATLAPAE